MGLYKGLIRGINKIKNTWRNRHIRSKVANKVASIIYFDNLDEEDPNLGDKTPVQHMIDTNYNNKSKSGKYLRAKNTDVLDVDDFEGTTQRAPRHLRWCNYTAFETAKKNALCGDFRLEEIIGDEGGKTQEVKVNEEKVSIRPDENLIRIVYNVPYAERAFNEEARKAFVDNKAYDASALSEQIIKLKNDYRLLIGEVELNEDTHRAFWIAYEPTLSKNEDIPDWQWVKNKFKNGKTKNIEGGLIPDHDIIEKLNIKKKAGGHPGGISIPITNIDDDEGPDIKW